MIFSRILLITLLLFIITPEPSSAQAEKSTIESFKLKNGMEVILIPSHRVPAVTQMLWYRVGAADDFAGRTGLAHYNEHMMFQGTNKLAAGEFSRIISSKGGRFNAFTGRDFTAYHVSISVENLPLVMEYEADRMLNLAPTSENFTKEREVIIEERRMSIDNKPDALLAEEMQALLFRNHPYKNPVIGWMSEMQALSREDVLAFHKKFYHPANAVLVVAGDIERAQLQEMAEKYYGVLPSGEKYVRNWQQEPPQRGARHTELKHKNVTQPELVRYYTAPSVSGDKKDLVVPSFLLTQILGGGNSSILYQELVVKQKIATNISISFDGIVSGIGTMEIYANPASGVSLAKLESAIDKAISEINIKKIPDSEIKRARILLKAETIYARDNMENMAHTLGALILSGLPVDYFDNWAKFIDNVTSDDIEKAFKEIFKPENSVTGYLLPEEKAKK
ncbi:MAG: pitrilysin family protein [Pseudomonadota bacterium]